MAEITLCSCFGQCLGHGKASEMGRALGYCGGEAAVAGVRVAAQEERERKGKRRGAAPTTVAVDEVGGG
jgi:hypothetical protein